MSEEDPLTKAMREAQEKKAAEQQRVRSQRQKSDERLAEVLRPLKDQVKAALAKMPFFDAGVGESGTVYTRNDSNSAVDKFAVLAHKTNPRYQATVTVNVRYDYGQPPSIGVYDEASGNRLTSTEGRLVRTSPTVGEKTAQFAVPVTIEQDGMLTLDADAMEKSLVAAITLLES